MKLREIPLAVLSIPIALIGSILFLLIGAYELFDEKVLGTKYEKPNKHYRSY